MNVEPAEMTHQSAVQPGDEQAQPQLTVSVEPRKAPAADDKQPDDDVVLPAETGVSGMETSCECDNDRRNGRDTHTSDKEGSSSQGQSSCSAPAPGLSVEEHGKEAMRAEEPLSEEENGRERLKRHRIEVAGRVWIPDIWGQEELLKDWIDCSAFDASLVPSGIMSARAALVEEGRRANSGRLRIENRC